MTFLRLMFLFYAFAILLTAEAYTSRSPLQWKSECSSTGFYAANTFRIMNHKFAGRSASRRTNHGYQ